MEAEVFVVLMSIDFAPFETTCFSDMVKAIAFVRSTKLLNVRLLIIEESGSEESWDNF